jgi:GT2 family glycosyltransferase
MPYLTDMSQQISVVMITRNRKQELRRTLQHLNAGSSIPVIVVDNHSNDGTADMIRREFPSVNVVPLTENAGAIGRNIGVQHASTPYIAFCDDDSWWEPDAFAKAVQVFEDYPRVGAIAGTLLVNDEEKLDYVSFLHSISPLVASVPMPGRAIVSFLGCGVFVRREAYLEVGGYNPKIKFSAEEWLLGIDLIAAGWGITYVEDIVGHHHPSKQRQMPRRYQMGARNALWATWLRRPWRSALRKTATEIMRAFGNRDQAIGVIESVTGIPYILSKRDVIPDFLEQQVQLLERQDKWLSGALRQKASLQIPLLAGAPG